MNLSVALLFTDLDPDAWRPLFSEASKLLYNATEKQMRLGTVKLFNNCPQAKDSADIIVRDEKRLAGADALGLGNKGQHIYLSRNRHGPLGGTDLGIFAIVHESGHYVFDLRDEYIGQIAAATFAPPGTPTFEELVGGALPTGNNIFFCTVPFGEGKASIMDSSFEFFAQARLKTEFCTDPAAGFSTSHVTGYLHPDVGGFERWIRTAQQTKHMESSWQTIVRTVPIYGITMTEPAIEPADDITGFQDIAWEVQDCRLRAVASIDRSGSMAGSQIAFAKAGATLFVNLSETGEDLGVTSFSSAATVNFPLQLIAGQSTKDSAKAAINVISAGGATSIGGGLRTALNELLMRTQRTDNEFIALISDGFHNSGESPASVLPDLKAERVKVFTIGIGNADVSTLANIASQTGGEFFFAASSSDLPAIFTKISATASGKGTIGQIMDLIEIGLPKVFNMFVDEFAEEATFVLSWGGSDLDLTLVAPDGTIVDPAFAAANPGTVEFLSAGTHEIYRIQQPQTGTWQIVVTAVDVNGTIPFSVQVLERSDEVQFPAFSDEDQYVFPEEVRIEALVAAGGPVLGVAVTGSVLRPDGSVIEVQLFDDGLPSHGDVAAGDGLYANFFSDYSEDGVYTFSLTADNETGVERAMEPFGAAGDPDPVAAPVAPFTRLAQFTVLVSGVPPGGGGAAVLLVLDDEAIDNGTSCSDAGFATGPGCVSIVECALGACPGVAGPPVFSDPAVLVNDDIASIPGVAGGCQQILKINTVAEFAGPRNPMPFITLPTGETGDGGLFSPAPSVFTGVAGGLPGYVACADAQTEDLLDGIAQSPLDAADISALEGRRVCAVVHDSDISDLGGGQVNAQGARNGRTAFHVNRVVPHPDGGSALPVLEVAFLEASAVDAACACENLVTLSGAAFDCTP